MTAPGDDLDGCSRVMANMDWTPDVDIPWVVLFATCVTMADLEDRRAEWEALTAYRVELAP